MGLNFGSYGGWQDHCLASGELSRNMARPWWPVSSRNNDGDEELHVSDNAKKRRRRLRIMFMRLWKLKKRERRSDSNKQDNLAPPKLVDRLLGKLKDELHQHLHPHHRPPPAAPAPQPAAPAPSSSEVKHEMYAHASQLFPEVPNTAAPDPSRLWSDELRNAPLPTNSFWLNYVLNDGSQPEYIHPYLVQSKPGSFTVCYPARIVNPAFIIQAFAQDLTIAHGRGAAPHVVSHYDDLSVTLEVPGKRLKVPLVRGCPYVTLVFKGYAESGSAPLVVSTIHAVLDLWSSGDGRKHRLVLNNGQTWVLYASSGLDLRKEGTSRLVSSQAFSGVLRVAVVPSPEHERVLDAFSGRYPVRGHATFDQFSVGFEWKSRGHGDDLLMLCLPMHRQIMHSPCAAACRIPELTYSSIDGPLEGILGDRWVLREQPISAGWYSSRGISDLGSKDRIRQALDREVGELQPIATSSAYFYGKAVARAARMAVIAEEIGHYSVVEKIRGFLVDSLTPWLDGSCAANGIVFDAKWGGLVSRVGARDSGADFGNGSYNDHHYHWGYFVYAGAVLAKLDNAWARAFKPHLYALVADFMAFKSDSGFPRLRCFDLWLLHSWAGGLVEFADGRNQESTSEAVNAYYAAALLGMAYGDVWTINHALTLTALEVRAAKALWHIPSSSSSGSIYEPEFSRDNRLIGVLWANKRDTGLWFAPAESRECRLGIQVLPITPITESLFDDPGFARELVNWARPRLNAEGVTDGWKGFIYALQAVSSERDEALHCTLALHGHDDGNSLSNMLWWILSR